MVSGTENFIAHYAPASPQELVGVDPVEVQILSTAPNLGFKRYG